MLKLKELRTAKGFSQRELADIAGVHRRTIEDAEARGDCRLSTAAALAKALQVPIDSLWTEIPEE